MVLTERAVRALAPEAVRYEARDEELNAFFVRVQPSGRKTFYCDVARGDRRSLGVFGALSVAVAREAAKAAIAEHQLAKSSPHYARSRKRAPTLATFIADQYAPWVREHRRDAEGTLERLRLRYEEDL
jgi:hypothetical protein